MNRPQDQGVIVSAVLPQISPVYSRALIKDMGGVKR